MSKLADLLCYILDNIYLLFFIFLSIYYLRIIILKMLYQKVNAVVTDKKYDFDFFRSLSNPRKIWVKYVFAVDLNNQRFFIEEVTNSAWGSLEVGKVVTIYVNRADYSKYVGYFKGRYAILVFITCFLVVIFYLFL